MADKLTGTEILEIIKVGKDLGLTTLKYGDLELTFGKQTESKETPNLADKEISAETHSKQNQDTLETDELALRDEQIAMALVENPVLAEQLMAEGELHDESSPDADDDAG